MKDLVLLLFLWSVTTSWCKPTTVVNFSPVGYTPGVKVAPGFAYAFRAPAPLYPPTSIHTASNNLLTGPATGKSVDAPAPTVIKTQYHSQDQLGQYAYGYVGDASTAHEVRTLDGAVQGTYTYLDANGELQTAKYQADQNGFRVEATNLPSPPELPVHFNAPLPEPVTVTPEVAAATAAHMKAVAEVKASRAKRSAPSTEYLPPSPVTKKAVVVAPVKKVVNVPLKKVAVPVLASSHPKPVVHTQSVPLSILSNPLPNHLAATHSFFVKANPNQLKSLTPLPLSSVLASPIPAPLHAHVALTPVAAPAHILSQFHAQNELGGYEYGYEGGPSSKHEVHTPDGITRGSYSYIDAAGEPQTVSYVSDDVHGFRVLASNLPEAPADPYRRH